MRQHYGDCGYPDIRGEAKPYIAGSISQKTEEDPHPKPGFAMSGNRGEEQRTEQCPQSARCHEQAHTQHGTALVIGPSWVLFTVMGPRYFPVRAQGIDAQRRGIAGSSLLMT